MQFRKHEDFALLFMGELTMQPDKRVALSHIAHIHGVSPLYLKKIVRRLKRAGLVQSKEGASGGYRIARSPRSISVWDVVQAVSGNKTKPPDPVPAHAACPVHKDCLPQTIRHRVRGILEAELRALSLQELVRKSV